jgi:anaerobic selenocysteine-containing dehydrogenase
VPVETKKSFCRICPGFCAVEVDVEDGQVVAVRGDASDPATGGYTCMKGRQVPAQMSARTRLRASRKRGPGGVFEEIPSAQLLDEVAQRLTRLVEQFGPRAVAVYAGTFCHYNAGAIAVARGWLEGIGSPSFYTSLTIDQPAKILALGRIGLWGGGTHSFASSDVALVVGNNPPVSHLAVPSGVPGFNPIKALNEASRRGLKLICIDPRRSELARRAELHLQVRPGEDPTLLAGMLRVILEEGLHDTAFCEEHVEGIDALSESIADFTPEHVAARTGVPAGQMIEAARLFACGPRGCATSGSGPDMAPHPNASEHLISALNIVCGRFNRVGEEIDNPGVLGAALPRFGQAIPPVLLPPLFSLGGDPAPRVRGLQRVFEEMPTAALAEEILTPGEGQVRALIVVGGNPVQAWPDQKKTLKALADLDLLVVSDPRLTATAELADYVIAPKLPLERDDLTLFADMFYEKSYAHYAPAVVEPSFDVIDDCEFFLGLARRMGTDLPLPAGLIDPAAPFEKYTLLEQLTTGSRIPLAAVREKQGGHSFEDELTVLVDPPMPGLEARLNLAPDGVCGELRAIRSEPTPGDDEYAHLLICRRMREVMNSVGQDFPETRVKCPTNPAYMSPADLEALGLRSGDLVEISSELDTITAVTEATDELQPGVISMAHCWGEVPSLQGDVRSTGSAVSRLIPTDRHFDPITGMPRFTAIPVKLRAGG